MSTEFDRLLDAGPAITRPESCVVVIFGASGDLTKRKLIPALYNLALNDRLPERFAVVGYARSDMGHDEFRRKMRAAVTEFSRTALKNDSTWDNFAAGLYYVPGGYDEAEGFQRLKGFLSELRRDNPLPNCIFYLATPPNVYAPVIEQLAAAGLTAKQANSQGSSRIVIEKPFGHDLKTAHDLNLQVHQVFDESQVYRIDHYLGKETVQNIMVLRFANAVFEPIWNRRYIDHVQITAAESVGVEGRGGYYEESGVIRDMFQNHLLQLLCLTAMEPPVGFSADGVRDEKVKLLRSARPLSVDEIPKVAVRGQYGAANIDGKGMKAYREEAGVRKDSMTETYAGVKLFIENWRWQGVPFYLRSGKAMAKRVTEVAIQFKEPPLLLFKSCALDQFSPNTLVLRIQPEEGISLTFEVKPPGGEICVRPLSLDFSYKAAFGGGPPDAYETLLLDSMRGDSTLFIRHDWIELAWSLLTPVLEAWESGQPHGFPNYQAGTWGPEEADALMESDGRQWRRP